MSEDVNPILHMDEQYMWRWYEIDDLGQTAFMSAHSFFSWKECRRDYDVAIRRMKRR